MKQSLTILSKSPVKDHPPPSMVPKQDPNGEMLCFQTQWFIHSFISLRLASQWALPQNNGKTCHHPQSPTWAKGLHI